MGKYNFTLRSRANSNNKSVYFIDSFPPVFRNKKGNLIRKKTIDIDFYTNPKSPSEKQYNKQQKIYADAILLNIRNQYDKPEIYGPLEREQLLKNQKIENAKNTNFYDILNKCRTNGDGSIDTWKAAMIKLKNFQADITVGEIDDVFINRFQEYLNNLELSSASKSLYFTHFLKGVKYCVNNKLLLEPLSKFKRIKAVNKPRNFLTLNELNKLASTPFKDVILKKAALFSALTSLRGCDIKRLTINNFVKEDDNYFLLFSQKKTDKAVRVPISRQAFELFDPKFSKLSDTKKDKVKEWVKAAGINKYITFHCFRHTYGTLQLTAGTDLYTISKMMGINMNTAMVYAKLVDEKKVEASSKITIETKEVHDSASIWQRRLMKLIKYLAQLDGEKKLRAEKLINELIVRIGRNI